MNHYDRLGVVRSASYAEIRTAYRRLARRMHPDTNRSVGAATEMAELNAAWHVLSDPSRRADYDRALSAPQRDDAVLRADPVPRPPSAGTEDADDWADGIPVDDAVLRRWLHLIVGTSVLAVVVVAAMFVYAFTRSVG